MIIGSKVTNPGEMRTQITLGTRTVATGAGGFQTDTFVSFATVWAKWTNIYGQETWQAAALNASKPATVLIRYNASLDETCLIQKGSDVYEIVSIDNIGERGEYMELKVRLMVES
jgi:SPP1 family predicted phage head-tail adaptor